MSVQVLPNDGYINAVPQSVVIGGYANNASSHSPSALATRLANALVVGATMLVFPSGATAQSNQSELSISSFRSVRADRSSKFDTRARAIQDATIADSDELLGRNASSFPSIKRMRVASPAKSATVQVEASSYPVIADSTSQAPLPVVSSVVDRLIDLSEEAKEDGEAISAASSADFLTFVAKHRVALRPSIAALDNGDVRALWKNADREQVAIHFKGHNIANYVFFYLEDGEMKREYDTASLDNVSIFLASRNLRRLLGA